MIAYTYQRAGNGGVLRRTVRNRRIALDLIAYSITENGPVAVAAMRAFLAAIVDGQSATYGPYTFIVAPETPRSKRP